MSVINGHQIPFNETPVQRRPPEQQICNDKELMQMEIQVLNLITKKAIEEALPVEGQFLSTIFLVPKLDGSFRFILNLNKLNESIQVLHFKIEDIRSVKNISTPNAFMASIVLKDAYFLVPVNKKRRKYLRFIFKDKIYQFRCLPFGLCLSPYIFMKIMKPVINALRKKVFITIIYLDDILLTAKKI